MKRTTTWVALVAAWVAVACSKPATFAAEVELQIDGSDHGYTSSSAQIDRLPGEGTLSYYLLRDPGQDAEPSLFVRHFQGNPVAKLWLRYNKPGVQDSQRARFSCYIPSTLRDGRATLGWKNPDGSVRDRSETGDANCEVKLRKEGSDARIYIDATLKNEHEERDPSGTKIADTVRVKAQVRLRGVY